jgi:hypothetical protein
MPDKVHEVRGIFAIVNREGWIETDLLGVLAQQTRADAVICAGPRQRIRHDPGIVAQDLARDAFDPLRHLGRRAPRERHQQNPAGVRAPDDQVGDSMGEGVGLAGARSRNDEQRCCGQSSRGAVLDGTPLSGIEGFEVRGCCLHRGCPSMVGRIDGR